MKEVAGPLEIDRRFFAALTSQGSKTLEEILTDDFVLIDVMTGSEVIKPALIAAIESAQLVFERIEPFESRMRQFGETAVITGRTEIAGQYGGIPFAVRSRYTHVFFKRKGMWVLVSAQGTPITTSD